jgi:parallel beta-helix repeat protein
MGPAWIAASLSGVLAAAAPWLERLRPLSIGERAASDVHVTSGEDRGIGSLREAIFMADRADRRVRILIQVPLITLGDPLPPIINPKGVSIEARAGNARLDATNVGAGAVLDVSAPDTVISGVEVYGAREQAILLRNGGARLTNVILRKSQTGIYVVEGVADLTVSQSLFDGNAVGIHVDSHTDGVRVVDNRFQRHLNAAIWSVAPPRPDLGTSAPISIVGNRFERDRASVVLINAAARLERNTFVGARTAAMLLDGAAAVIRSNHIRSGLGFGISAESLDHSVISDNEIDHNCAGGILVRNSQNTHLLSNRLYTNGYGIVMVLGAVRSPNTVADNLIVRQVEDGLYIIGASPRIQRNRLMQNRRAGLRLSSLLAVGTPAVGSEPFVEANLLEGNGTDVPVLDSFQASTGSEPSGGPPDCAWRLDPIEPRQQIARSQ